MVSQLEVSNRSQEDERPMTMMKIYNSFLIRCWQLRNTSQADRLVFEIEHIQTGERQRVTSLAELQRLLFDRLTSASDPLQCLLLGAQKKESDE
jgi:hypothetical protein